MNSGTFEFRSVRIYSPIAGDFDIDVAKLGNGSLIFNCHQVSEFFEFIELSTDYQAPARSFINGLITLDGAMYFDVNETFGRLSSENLTFNNSAVARLCDAI